MSEQIDKLLTEIRLTMKPYCAAVYGGVCKSDGDNDSCRDCNKKAKVILTKAREVVKGAGLTEKEIEDKFENDWDGLDQLSLAGQVQDDVIQAILKALGGE